MEIGIVGYPKCENLNLYQTRPPRMLIRYWTVAAAAAIVVVVVVAVIATDRFDIDFLRTYSILRSIYYFPFVFPHSIFYFVHQLFCSVCCAVYVYSLSSVRLISDSICACLSEWKREKRWEGMRVLEVSLIGIFLFDARMFKWMKWYTTRNVCWCE